MTTAHQDSLAAFFGRSPLSAVHQGPKEFCYSVIFFQFETESHSFFLLFDEFCKMYCAAL